MSNPSAHIGTKLTAPEPGWFAEADVIVIGSGVAGLTAAIQARTSGYKVILVTKAHVDDGSTRWAQGGIAAALDPNDSPEEHWRDTIVAGAGLCDSAAARVLVVEGPNAIRRLISRGANFDKTASGAIALTREGGHHRDRIAHAGGDATGAEISRALVDAIANDPEIELIENALVLDLLQDESGAAQGVTLHVMGQGMHDGVGALLAPAVILATGGIGQVFSQSTNPRVATGDGIALALRAGAALADLEFIQFHPTVLFLGPEAKGQQPLISEAVRGEGAFLVDEDGKHIMDGVHPMADLAPRDIVSIAIMKTMLQKNLSHVWLDARKLGDSWLERFPTIFNVLLGYGIDPRTDLIPVAPAQHYHSGGIRTDLYGRTNIPGLFACGEVACTGVHGANRLASNSLLEGLVFAERIGALLALGLPERRGYVNHRGSEVLLDNELRSDLQNTMTRNVGVLRSADSAQKALAELAPLNISTPDLQPNTKNWEISNLHTVATAISLAALTREETRGSHWREDFPQSKNIWLKRILIKSDATGQLSVSFEPVPQVPDTKEVL
jgi:L-aspartate oxidase